MLDSAIVSPARRVQGLYIGSGALVEARGGVQFFDLALSCGVLGAQFLDSYDHGSRVESPIRQKWGEAVFQVQILMRITSAPGPPHSSMTVARLVGGSDALLNVFHTAIADRGAGFALRGANIKVSGITLHRVAGFKGAGFYLLKNTTADVSDVTINEANATVKGAAVFSAGEIGTAQSFAARGFSVKSCRSPQGAGFFLDKGTTMTVTDFVMENLHAAKEGGVSCLAERSSILLENGRIQNTSAGSEGGAFHAMASSNITLRSVQATDSSAGDMGGFALLKSDSTFRLEYSPRSKHSSTRGRQGRWRWRWRRWWFHVFNRGESTPPQAFAGHARSWHNRRMYPS